MKCLNIHVDQKLPVTASAPPAVADCVESGGLSYNPSTGIMTTPTRGALSLKQPISANTGELLVSVAVGTQAHRGARVPQSEVDRLL